MAALDAQPLARRTVLLAGSAMLCLGPAARAQDRGDRAIVAGERVGAIRKSTKPADLPALFGPAAIRDTEVGSEGDTWPGAMIHADTDDALEVAFARDRSRIEFVTVLGRNWATAAGVRVGATLADLVRINGGPFQFNGFGWELGGLVREAPTHRIAAPGLRVFLDAGRAAPAGEGTAVDGDREVSSDHPALREMDVRVVLLQVEFAD